MFTCILIPLDGSARAERALPVAARIAHTATDARVLLVRAVSVPVTFGMMYEGQALKWRLYRDEREEAQKYLRDVAQSAHLASLHVDTFIAVGPAAEVIVDAAVARGADLVVMTSHGRTGLDRWVLGSVAEHVAHHSPVPVLILREHAGMTARERAEDVDRPLRILVPLDGSPLAETALAPASALALALDVPRPGSIHLMLVVPPYRADPENMPDALLLDGAAAYLEQVAQRLRSQAVQLGRVSQMDAAALTVTWSVVAHGDIAHAILAAAETGEASETQGGSVHLSDGSDGSDGYDLIAMATHGLGAAARWALGSVTERVLHGTTLPLLIVRPTEVAAGATDRRE